MMRFLSLLMLGLCDSVVSVVMWASLALCVVGAVVALTVMRVLLFV